MASNQFSEANLHEPFTFPLQSTPRLIPVAYRTKLVSRNRGSILKLHLIDSDLDVASALQVAFARFTEVEVRHGDLLMIAEQCVVSPANSFGFMDGGFDRALYSFFGPSIQIRVQDAINRRPEGCLPVGASLVIRTGHRRIPFLLVAPTVTLPEQVEASNAYRAMRAVLRIARAESATFSHVFCPGLTTGVAGVAPSEAAHQMARAYNDFTNGGAAPNSLGLGSLP